MTQAGADLSIRRTDDFCNGPQRPARADGSRGLASQFMLKRLKQFIPWHPRAFAHSLLTYPRFLGRIKPEFQAMREEELRARLLSLHRCWETKQLQTPFGHRLLVLAPHPDDETIGVGGTLLAHRGKSEIHIINLFDGSGGGRLAERPWEDLPDYRRNLVAERRRELAEIGTRLKVSSIQHLDLVDGIAVPNLENAEKLRSAIEKIRPDVILLPWFLDNQRDHRVTNILFGWSCAQLDCMVMGFETWLLCQPNGVLDITPFLEDKLDLIKIYKTQVATVDYHSYVRGLAATRAFLHPINSRRSGAVEAFFTLPGRDYCDVVCSFYGSPGSLNPALSSVL